MEIQQEHPFTGNEIWEYLQNLPVDELASYDLRIEALAERVQQDILRLIPGIRMPQFQHHFINKHFTAKERQLHHGEDLFRKALLLELRDTVVLAKNMLFDIITKHDLFLGDNIPARFSADEINQAYYETLSQHDEFFIMSEYDSEILMKRMQARNPNYAFYTSGKNGGENIRLAITPANIHLVLDCIGYELLPAHREYGDIFARFNEHRLSLSEEVHQRIFGKSKNANSPFVINREFAADLFICRQNVLNHEQTTLLWYALSEEQRRELFANEDEPHPDRPIILKRGVSHLKLLNTAAENYHNIQLSIPQSKKLLSQLTLAQLCEMDNISYHKAVDAGRSALTSGSQYLGTYSINTRYISQVINILMGAALKASIYATAIASLVVGSLVLGIATAIIQYHQNTQREERFRLSHISYALAINRKRKETQNEIERLARAGLTRAQSGQTRLEQLISIIQNAGLMSEFKNGIQISQASAPIKHAITASDKQLNQLYQINSLTCFLQINREKIADHFQRLERIRKESNIVSERLELTRKMKQTDNLLRFTDATHAAAPLPVKQDNVTILSTPNDHSFAAKRHISLSRGWNRVKQYFKSKKKILRPLVNGIAATVFVSLSLFAAIILLASGVGTIAGLSIAAVCIGVLLGIASYKTVQRAQMMKQVQEDDTEALNKEKQHADQLNNFRIATSTLQQIEHQDHSSFRVQPNNSATTLSHDLKPTNRQETEFLISEHHKLRQENALLKARAIQMQAELAAFKHAEAVSKSSPLREYSFIKTSHDIEHPLAQELQGSLVIN